MRPAWLALGLLFAAPAHAGERWPLWPSEVTRAAEPLRVGEARQLLVVPEAHKLQALRALERYPTALVAPILLESLTDGTASIRREALQACLERVLLECIPGALRQWHSETPDTGARIAALRVLALDAPTAPGRPELLISALRDPDESVRAEAAHTLARVTWPDDLLLRVRTALIGKLADTAPPVRRAAARSLGLLGPLPGRPAARSAARGDPPADLPAAPTPSSPATPAPSAPTGPAPSPPDLLAAPATSPGPAPAAPRDPGLRLADPAPLALARLLADPDPQVRQDAAEALGNLRDPRAAPPLLRALEAGDEVYVSRAMVLALAALPGLEVDAALLRLLDVPPRGLTYRTVGEALGRRPAPSPALVDGLVARMREETLQGHVLDVLLLLGDAAAPALRAARARGLEPQLERAVDRLLAALTPPTDPPRWRTPWPDPADRDAWHRRLGDAREGLAAAAALALAAPPWLGPAAAGALARELGPAQRRPWLLALAAAARPHIPDDDAVTHARLAAWAGDPGLAVLDRCLALAALTHGHARSGADLAAATLAAVAADPRPAMRACAAAATDDDPLLAALLRDESPRVRAAASFHVAACPLPPGRATQATIARLAAQDTHPGVVRAAQAALARLRAPSPERCDWQLIDLGEPRPRTQAEGAGLGWVDLRWHDRDLRLPAEPLGERRWLLFPGLDDAAPLGPDAAPVRRDPP